MVSISTKAIKKEYNYRQKTTESFIELNSDYYFFELKIIRLAFLKLILKY